MNFSDNHNAGASVLSKYGTIVQSFTAAATGDNTKVTSSAVDRHGFNSCQVAIPYSVNLTTAKKATLSLEISDSLNDSDYNTAIPLFTTVDMATATGASTGCYVYNVDLADYGRYVKFGTTIDLTASGTDTCTYAAVVVLGGAASTPTS